MFTIDRVQFSELHQKFILFEFLEVDNIFNFLDPSHSRTINGEIFWQEIFKTIPTEDKSKLSFLFNLKMFDRHFIIYQETVNKYILISYIDNDKGVGFLFDFEGLQKWFKSINNIDIEKEDEAKSYSKPLGSARDLNYDTYVNNILKELYCNDNFNDDNGLTLTKQLLDGNVTKGFDLDLFKFIPSTSEYLIFEFLKRENNYINNIQAHPMRYCWNNSSSDNKRKFISLWKVKQHLNARLFLVNYSDNINEKISIMEIHDLSETDGILSESKYCMTNNIFKAWLKDMSIYSSSKTDYLSDFVKIEYDEDFFKNFKSNKSKYGDSFKNIYI